MEAEGSLPWLKAPRRKINIYYNANCIFILISLFLKNKVRLLERLSVFVLIPHIKS
jgi:hypothetical protein